MNLLFSDIDGTLIHNRILTFKDYQSIKKFKKHSPNLFILSTGRGIKGFNKVKKRYSLNYDYAILSGGALIIDKNDKLLYKNCLNVNFMHELAAFIEENFALIKVAGFETVDGYVKFKDIKKIKDYLNEGHEDIANISLEFENSLGAMKSTGKTSNHYSFRVNNKYLDITNQDVTKGTAMKKMQSYLDTSELVTFSIGDNWNDMDMFEVSDYSFTFKNSPAELQNHVSFIVNSFNECINRVLLICEQSKN